jgi:predicted aldo/keto reductase-like oxidoreductase
MRKEKKFTGMNRREFLKAGVLGTTSALLATNALAEAVQQYAAAFPFVYPEPVYRTLGRTGMKITVVSFGAMLTPEPEVMKVAFEHGINYVNTARAYMGGKNEDTVGKALKGLRSKVYVATKILKESNLKADMIRDVETSLKALGTDYIDVIQFDANAGKERVFLPEAREALTKLKEQGKVRFCGVATHKNQTEVLNALADDTGRFFDMALVGYNFKSEKELMDAIDRAARSGVGIIAMKTQAGGYATKALGNISPHQAALKWVLQNPNISAAIPGMKDLAEFKENIAVMGMPFKVADQRILERYSQAVDSYYCRLCGTCEGTCPHGVEISSINRSLMYAEGAYRNRELALATYREIPATARATACLDCPGCVASCVKGLNISAKMDRARQLLG